MLTSMRGYRHKHVASSHKQKSFRNDLLSVSTNHGRSPAVVPPQSSGTRTTPQLYCAKPTQKTRAMKKDRMSERLSELQVFELVKIYKEYECLWDVTNENYKNRHVRDNAYKEILEKLNIPRLKVSDIPQKIKNLRTSYYSELKKIENSVREGGKVYKPKVAWFSIADEVLRNISSSGLLWNPNEEKNVETESEPEPLITKTIKTTSPQNLIATLDKIATEITPQTTSSQTDEPQIKYYQDDEFDVYGKYIAMSLRSMPEEMSIVARMELQKTMADIQLKVLKKKRRVTNLDEDGPSTSKMEEDPLEVTVDNAVELEPHFTLNVKVEEDEDL